MSRRRSLIAMLVLLPLGLTTLTGCGSLLVTPANADPGVSTTGPAERRGDPLLTDEEAAAIDVDADLVYREVDGEQLELDVCHPPAADGPHAAVLLIHGGGFTAGDKDARQWQAICRWVADAGYVAVNVNYRLAPEHPFPAAIDDVQAAAEWTRANADSYDIDPDRVGVLGGSAGANLAQLLGTTGEDSTTTGSRVSAVVSLSGPADLTQDALVLGRPDDRQIQTVLNYLGCRAIRDCPQSEAASPITQVDPTDPPFLLVHSEQERMPVQQAQAMADALADAGADPEVLIRPGQAHATALLADRTVQDAVLVFLNRTLA